MSYEAFSEGFCWDCGGRLSARAEGWSACPKCDRWFRAEGTEIVERIPIPWDGLGKTWSGGGETNSRLVLKDGSTVPVVYDHGQHFIPADARYFEMRTPV